MALLLKSLVELALERLEAALTTKVLTDFPDCGRRQGTGMGMGDECMWTCDWKDNPLYRTITTFDATLTDGRTISTDIYWSLFKLPSSLSCLQSCAAEFTNTLAIQAQNIPSTQMCQNELFTDYIDCYFSAFRQQFDGTTFNFEFANFYDIVMGACLAARLDPTLYPGESCDNIPLPIIRISGPGTSSIVDLADSQAPHIQRYPWLCSLRTRGFRGRHHCGVTLLHGPTMENGEDCTAPTILVSSAHCNYVCKDEFGATLEYCCCRQATEDGSCHTSSYCRGRPELKEAEPRDLQIVCGEWSIEEAPEQFSPEEELVLDVLQITNHPDYNLRAGPIEGSDIAVYHVDSAPLCAKGGVKYQNNVYPACLPRDTYSPDGAAIIAGWIDPTPSWQEPPATAFGIHRLNNLLLRQARMTEVACQDPAWMRSNTFYPAGTRCYSDPSAMTCHSFGTSGSPVVRKLPTGQYAWVGPLSFYNGCDRGWIYERPFENPDRRLTLLEAGENPGVFTDGACYLDWVAEQYGMRMPEGWSRPSSCSLERGDRADKDIEHCITNIPLNMGATSCRFTDAFPKCRTYAVEGYAKAVNTCEDNTGNRAICPNNCLGVDPSAIIVGGLPVFASALGGLTITTMQALGIATGGVGAATAMSRATCRGPIFCRGRGRCAGRCCMVINGPRGLQCNGFCC